MKKNNLIIAIGMLLITIIVTENAFSAMAKYQCITNGSVRYTSNPAPGKDHWTYNYVDTVIENGVWVDGVHCDLYQTYCYSPGIENCRVKYSMVGPIKNNSGIIVCDQDFLSRSCEMMYDYVENVITEDETATEGSASFNEVHEGYNVYRTIKWYLAPGGEIIKDITIGFNE